MVPTNSSPELVDKTTSAESGLDFCSLSCATVVERKENDKSRQMMILVIENRFDLNVNIN
jgi:hypothetical protein